MGNYWRCGLAAAAVALGAQSALGQSVNGCPAGQAMQSSDPSGRNVTCVSIPDTEADIVGTWSVSGPTSCLVSSRGFNADLAPVQIFEPAPQPTIVTQLTATSMGTRTFNADGTGTASGSTQALTFAGDVVTVLGTAGAGGAAVSSFTNHPFTWHIQPDGKLHIDDAGPIVQVASAPASRAGWTFTIDKTPAYEGFISKDKKTIVMTHPAIQLEISITLDQNGNPPLNSAPSQRLCTRHRILTRLAD